MTPEPSSAKTEFDEYAANYDDALARGISVSGEDKEFFAKGRIAWLERCLRELNEKPRSVLDFGCGTGSATPHMLEILKVNSTLGVDVSAKSLEVAKQTHGSERSQFFRFNEFQPKGEIDLAFCNGVFHHVPLNERAAVVNYVYRSLRPGGLFALWENNPWNPGARIVMSRIPFDRDAIMLSPPETRHLLVAGGFDLVRTDSLFFFPRMLSWLRGLESTLSRLPLGAQYQVLARKPMLC